MITSAHAASKETRGEFRIAATAGSPGRDTSTGHMKLGSGVAEIRATTSRVTWRRSVAEHAL